MSRAIYSLLLFVVIIDQNDYRDVFEKAIEFNEAVKYKWA